MGVLLHVVMVDVLVPLIIMIALSVNIVIHPDIQRTIVVMKEATFESASEGPPRVEVVFREFQDMFKEDLPNELLPTA